MHCGILYKQITYAFSNSKYKIKTIYNYKLQAADTSMRVISKLTIWIASVYYRDWNGVNHILIKIQLNLIIKNLIRWQPKPTHYIYIYIYIYIYYNALQKQIM